MHLSETGHQCPRKDLAKEYNTGKSLDNCAGISASNAHSEEGSENSPPTKSLVDMSRAALNTAGEAVAEDPPLRALCLRRLPSLLKAAINTKSAHIDTATSHENLTKLDQNQPNVDHKSQRIEGI
jgi:hypothetical protein